MCSELHGTSEKEGIRTKTCVPECVCVCVCISQHRSHGVDVYGLENAEEGSLGVYGAPDTVQRGPVDPTLNLGQVRM